MDKYQQHELLGQGNNSVYRATRISDGVDVALKRVRGWVGLKAADQEVALREVAVLRTLEHPHTIRLLDTFSDKGDLCLVLPIVRPGARVFEEEALPLTPAAVARVGFQLASALAYLHGLEPQLLHRDIKPANLLLVAAPGALLPPPGPLSPAQASALVEAGSVLLSDFGSALAMRKTQATGTTSGTPAFKASEILREEKYAAPADMWSLGVTLLQLATGHVVGGTSAARRAIMGLIDTPWMLQQSLEGTHHDTFEKVGEEEAWMAACAAQRRLWEGLGAPLQQLIEGCLVVQAKDRVTAEALLHHAAFEMERKAQTLASAVKKLGGVIAAANTHLIGGGGSSATCAAVVVTLDELLAVLEAEAGVGVQTPVLQRACLLVGAASQGVGDALLGRTCAALLGLMGSKELDRKAAAIKALRALQGVGGAGEIMKSGISVVLSSAVEIMEHQSAEAVRLAAEGARLAAENLRLNSKVDLAPVLRAENARLAAEVTLLKARMAVVPAVTKPDPALEALKNEIAQLKASIVQLSTPLAAVAPNIVECSECRKSSYESQTGLAAEIAQLKASVTQPPATSAATQVPTTAPVVKSCRECARLTNDSLPTRHPSHEILSRWGPSRPSSMEWVTSRRLQSRYSSGCGLSCYICRRQLHYRGGDYFVEGITWLTCECCEHYYECPQCIPKPRKDNK